MKNRNNNLKYNLIYLTFSYTCATAFILFFVACLYNNSFAPSNTAATSSTTGKNTPSPTSELASIQNLPPNAKLLSHLDGIPPKCSHLAFSHDGHYCIYCNKGILSIMDTQQDKVINEIHETNPITYAILMYDRNYIIYFVTGTSSKSKNQTDEIRVYTYNIDTKEKLMETSVNISKGASIMHVDYSALYGFVYFDIDIGNKSSIYYIDLYKRLNKVLDTKQIEDIAPMNDKKVLYFVSGSILYCNNAPVKGFDNTNIKFLGCDIKDNLFIQSKNDNSILYSIKGKSEPQKIKLENPNIKKSYSNKNAVYLVYNDYFIDLSNNPNTKIPYDPKYTFQAMDDNRLYLSDENNRISIVLLK